MYRPKVRAARARNAGHVVFESGSFRDPVIAALVERLQARMGPDGTLRHEAAVLHESSRAPYVFGGDRQLAVETFSDRGKNCFSGRMVLRMPPMHDLFADGSPLDVTHVLINVRSPFFAENRGWEYEVRLHGESGSALDVRVFSGWYAQHQFWIPLTAVIAGGTLTLTATATAVGEHAAAAPVFEAEVLLCSKDEVYGRLERGAVWIFSTARAGSTWLASDLLCAKERARPIDENGIGRMFAPLQWDAERFFNLADRAPSYAESGFTYETGSTPRTAAFLPPFERNFTNMRLDNQILSRRNFEFYHRLLREAAIEHVINEWGCLDFTRTVFKCPNDAHAADFIMRAFPKAAMVFLMRDGRDVMRSRFSAFGSEELAESKHKGLRRHAIAYYSHWWNFQVDIIASAYEAHAEDKRILVKFEDLRSDTYRVVSEIFRTLNFDAADEEIRELVDATRLENFKDRGSDKPRQSGLIGGYRALFDEDEVALMNAIMGPNLRRYGYEAP